MSEETKRKRDEDIEGMHALVVHSGPTRFEVDHGHRGVFIEEKDPGTIRSPDSESGSEPAAQSPPGRSVDARRFGFRSLSSVWPMTHRFHCESRDPGYCTWLTLMTIEHDPSVEERRARDLALVRGSLKGNEESIEWLAARLSCVPRILHSLNRRLGTPLGPDDIADLSQDTLIVIWGKLPSFEGRGRIETWAYRFCFLIYMNRLRRRERRSSLFDPSIEKLDSLPADIDPSIHEYEILEVGLEELGPPEAEIIRLKHFDSRTFAEIADKLDISSNTAKSRYYRGLAWLKRRLAPVIRGERE